MLSRSQCDEHQQCRSRFRCAVTGIMIISTWPIFYTPQYSNYRETSSIRRTKSKKLNVSRLVLQLFFAQSTEARFREWRYSWSNTDNYTWVINSFIVAQCACYIRRFTVMSGYIITGDNMYNAHQRRYMVIMCTIPLPYTCVSHLRHADIQCHDIIKCTSH